MIINLYRIAILFRVPWQTECQAIMHVRTLREIIFEMIILKSICSASYNQLLPSCYSGFALCVLYHL